jgi:hypothetical protein
MSVLLSTVKPARRTLARQIMRLSRNTYAVPEDAKRSSAVATSSACRRETNTNTNIYTVGLSYLTGVITYYSGVFSLPESSIAPILTALQKRVSGEGVRVGSYPVLQQGVYVSLIGYGMEKVRELAEELQRELQGTIVTDEEARARKGAE